MPDTAMRDHLTIVALLPDYVLGKLDETSVRRVTRHLDACPTCRRELGNAMDVLGELAAVSPPAPWLRAAILQRAAAQHPAAIRQEVTPGSVIAGLPATGKAGQNLDSDADVRRRMPFGQPLPRWALVAASAAIFLVSGLLGWNYDQRNAVIVDDRISALVNDPATAYPLDDSDLPVAAAGVVFAEPKGREVYLVANGLPVLPHDQRYQVWLFTTENTQESAGLLAVGADGEIRALLQTTGPFADYVGVGLTAEPQTGSVVPTSDMVLGGSFPPEIAALSSLPALLIPTAGND
jgi:anti-sigma-K factor RskA